MNSSVKELLDQKAALKEQMLDLVRRAEKEGRKDMLPDEDAQFIAIDKDYEAINEKIRIAKRVEELNAEKAEKLEQAKVEPKYEDVFWKYAKKGGASLSSPERNLLAQRATDPQTTTVTAGGYTIPQGFSNELSIAMAEWGGMLQAARIVKTKTGNTIDWPTVDDTGTIGAILTEAATGTVADITFAQKQLEAYMYYSKIVKVSVQLLEDSYFDLAAFLKDVFARRLGAAMNAGFTTGSGSSQPNGFVTAATVGSTTAANTTVTRPELVTHMHTVDPAYRNNAIWMMNDTSLSLIKKLAFGSADARPLWQLSMRDGEPDKVEGFPYIVNQDMASFGAGNKPIAFGDFSHYIVRFAGDTTFVRLDERYMDALLVGFLAYQRADGELIDTAAIKVLRNPTT